MSAMLEPSEHSEPLRANRAPELDRFGAYDLLRRLEDRDVTHLRYRVRRPGGAA